MMNLHAKLSAFVVALSALLLAGCASSEEPAAEHTPTHTCVILSNGYNMPTIENASDFIDTPADGDSITVIVLDGKPSVSTYSFNMTAKNSAAASKQKKEFLYKLSNTLSDARPDDAEVDTLAALHYASADMQDPRFANDEKKLIMLCNGISTTNLDMTAESFWTSDQTTLINQIVDAGYVTSSSFKNVDVTWHFITATDGQHQQALSPRQEKLLTEFWSSYFKAAGAEATIQNEPLSGPAAEAVPPIKAVPVINSDIIIDGAADADNNTSIQEQSVVITLPQEKLEFMPNSTDYKNEAQAALVLDNVSQAMLSTSNYLIVGSTARIGETSNTETAITLSCNRAKKIQKELINRGFSLGQLSVLGLGSTDSPLRSPMEENNRAVYILDRDSEIASEILSIYNNTGNSIS